MIIGGGLYYYYLAQPKAALLFLISFVVGLQIVLALELDDGEKGNNDRHMGAYTR